MEPALCVDVDALQRMSRSLSADAEVLGAVDVSAATNLVAAALASSATGAAAVSLADPIRAAYAGIAARLRDVAAGIDRHVRGCVASDQATAQRIPAQR
ncbi:MAG TPA: hypothetical protein VIW24_05200 [Aldersonia sp.]